MLLIASAYCSVVAVAPRANRHSLLRLQIFGFGIKRIEDRHAGLDVAQATTLLTPELQCADCLAESPGLLFLSAIIGNVHSAASLFSSDASFVLICGRAEDKEFSQKIL